MSTASITSARMSYPAPTPTLTPHSRQDVFYDHGEKSRLADLCPSLKAAFSGTVPSQHLASGQTTFGVDGENVLARRLRTRDVSPLAPTLVSPFSHVPPAAASFEDALREDESLTGMPGGFASPPPHITDNPDIAVDTVGLGCPELIIDVRPPTLLGSLVQRLLPPSYGWMTSFWKPRVPVPVVIDHYAREGMLPPDAPVPGAPPVRPIDLPAIPWPRIIATPQPTTATLLYMAIRDRLAALTGIVEAQMVVVSLCASLKAPIVL